jgi:hypothetical protein
MTSEPLITDDRFAHVTRRSGCGGEQEKPKVAEQSTLHVMRDTKLDTLRNEGSLKRVRGSRDQSDDPEERK